MAAFYLGVDVQSARGCPFAVLNGAAEMIRNGWLQNAGELRQLVTHLAASGAVVVGIDAPRMPLPGPRLWVSRRGRWLRASCDCGRHCEIVLKCLGLANPQWTPNLEQAKPWMQLGFEMFRELAGVAGVTTHEVFPSASYAMFQASEAPRVTLPLSGFEPGPKDMLDAVVAGVTVKEFTEGRGCEVGGGDGLGTIVLPRPLQARSSVHFSLTWPS